MRVEGGGGTWGSWSCVAKCVHLVILHVCVCVCVCFVCVPSPVTCMLRECRWAGEEAREEEEMVVERCCHDVKAGR